MNTLNKWLSLSVAALVLSACQTTPPKNVALENARQAYLGASADPQTAQHGALELERAKQALEKADAQWAKQRDETETRHMAYLVEQRVHAAQAAATGRQADADVRQAGTERQQLIADARAREAEQAKMQAAVAEMKADQARQQANSESQRAALLQSALESMAAQQTDRGTVVTLGDVMFDVGQATLRINGSNSVNKLAGVLRDYPEKRVLVEGYTDSTGSASFNQGLSERRAQTVKQALMAQGIPAARIEAHGYGKDKPVADNNSAAGRQQNRRVEIVISNSGGALSAR